MRIQEEEWGKVRKAAKRLHSEANVSLQQGLIMRKLELSQTPSRFDAPRKRLLLTVHVFLPTPTFLLYPNFASCYATHRLGTLVSGFSECDNTGLICHNIRYLLR